MPSSRATGRVRAFDDEVLRFGPLAARLEPRSLVSGVVVGARDAARVCVAFALGALEPAPRAALEATPGLTLEPRADGTAVLRGEREALCGPAASHPALAALVAAHDHALQAGTRRAPRIMGVVNVTPDSFSDGGLYADPEKAVQHALHLVEQGADVLDVGGESTRPGASPVAAPLECERVLPVIERLARASDVPISIDTQKSSVARRALAAGARIVNDVSAGRDPEMFPLVAEERAELVLMHMRGTPRTMQCDPSYGDPLREILAMLRERAAAALAAGIEARRLLIDPGIGFGKRLEDNLTLVRGLGELASLGLDLLVGVSRKSFLGSLTRTPAQAPGTAATSAAVAASVLFGADVVRVHDVEAMRPVVRVAAALARRAEP